MGLYLKDGRKRCTKCGKLKNKSQSFWKKSGKKDGLHSQCKTCMGTDHKKYYKKNRPSLRAKAAVYFVAVPTRNREAHLKSKYGITIERYDAMLRSQSGRCAICRTDKPGGSYGKSFIVDHHHGTGSVRGLLCGNCNSAIGLLQDSPAILRVAAQYIENQGALAEVTRGA